MKLILMVGFSGILGTGQVEGWKMTKQINRWKKMRVDLEANQ